MTRYDHFIRLLVLITFIIIGLFLTAIGSAVIMLLSGISLDELMNLQKTGTGNLNPDLTRLLLLAQHLFTFILPALAFGLLFYRKDWLKGLQIAQSPGWLIAIMGIFFLLAAYPLVNLSYLVNAVVPLPDWALDFENQAEETMRILLKMNSPLVFAANLVVIAILPGIGEELIFRGVLQKQLGFIFNNRILAIWTAAFIFSAIHLQFEGFLPRMALGVVLGYLYYWTGNLWVPMIAHAFNNGIQIVIIYATGLDISQVDETSSDQLQWWMIPLSVGVMYVLYNTILKNRKPIDHV
jgi:membrane protease YdiL (CAAX protease family)